MKNLTLALIGVGFSLIGSSALAQVTNLLPVSPPITAPVTTPQPVEGLAPPVTTPTPVAPAPVAAPITAPSM